MSKIKVILSAIWYPLCMGTYYWRAFERREDVELLVTGPFTGTWIPWNNGMNLPNKYVRQPDFPLPSNLASAGQIDPQILQVYEELQTFDLWLQIDAGFHFSKRPGKSGIVAHIKTDPHAIPVSYYDQASYYSDYVFNMQNYYIKAGEHWLPYAYDPTIHFSEYQKKVHDVCMIGLHYQQRNQVMDQLVRKGHSVYYDLGKVFDEYRQIYNASRIGFNWSSLQDLNARVFELAAMGIPAVENTVPDMGMFLKPNEHYLPFTTAEQAVDNIVQLLKNEKSAKEMVDRAKEAISPHTWNARVQQILETVGLV